MRVPLGCRLLLLLSLVRLAFQPSVTEQPTHVRAVASRSRSPCANRRWSRRGGVMIWLRHMGSPQSGRFAPCTGDLGTRPSTTMELDTPTGPWPLRPYDEPLDPQKQLAR